MFREDVHLDDHDIIFQIVDWYQTDFDDDEQNRSYLIKVFGVSSEGYSVCVNVFDFQPYFYITHKAKSELNNFDIDNLETKIAHMLPMKFKEDFEMNTEFKKTLWGFTNNNYKQYIKISFCNLTCMYIVRKFLRNLKQFDFHESNIDPFLRFIHSRDIYPLQDGSKYQNGEKMMILLIQNARSISKLRFIMFIRSTQRKLHPLLC